MSQNVNEIIAKTFLDLANYLEEGKSADEPVVAITSIGSELPEQDIIEGARLASKKGIKPVVIGSCDTPSNVSHVFASSSEDAHKIMSELLESKKVSAAVTMHYSFPIGTSTVGRVITPAKSKEMFIATTTGTSSSNRVEGMIKNAIYGIIAAKACGISEPTVGVLNIDGARQVEKALYKLKENGYDIHFSESGRADGGIVMRGNDLLSGTPDVMVCDSLTGNLLMKMFSSFTSGGNYETVGFGYGPGVSDNFDKLILIVSRVSGAPVCANAMQYAGELVRGKFFDICSSEFAKAKKAGLLDVISKFAATKEAPKETVAPPKEVVTEEILGIDIMNLDEAVTYLWQAGIYAETGMGCTGPVVLISHANFEKSVNILKEKEMIV